MVIQEDAAKGRLGAILQNEPNLSLLECWLFRIEGCDGSSAVQSSQTHRRERRRRWGAPPQAPRGEALKALEGAFLFVSRYTGTEREHNRVIIDRCDGRPTPLLVRG